jgi:hypothetical protein
MICWGLGGFGVGLTGALKVNTKEDMVENSRMIGKRSINRIWSVTCFDAGHVANGLDKAKMVVCVVSYCLEPRGSKSWDSR